MCGKMSAKAQKRSFFKGDFRGSQHYYFPLYYLDFYQKQLSGSQLSGVKNRLNRLDQGVSCGSVGTIWIERVSCDCIMWMERGIIWIERVTSEAGF
jgi:hypothetical protein